MNMTKMCYSNSSLHVHDKDLFPFEKNFNYHRAVQEFTENRKNCYYYISVYLVAIFALQNLMKSRPPFQLKGPLIIWNSIMALFSIVAALRMIPEMVCFLTMNGWYRTTCEPGPMHIGHTGRIWVYLFALSKLVELGDTGFIILRKKPLIFLHWYHHASVIAMTWGCSPYLTSMTRYCAMANLVVHSFMYSYFALKGLGIKISRGVSIVITSLQLSQMAFGLFVSGYAYWSKVQNPDCCVFQQAIVITGIVYTSYFVGNSLNCTPSFW